MDNEHSCEEMRWSVQRLCAVVTQAHDGLAFTDEQGLVIMWNQTLEQITGLKPRDVLNRPIWDVQFELTHVEERIPGLRERFRSEVVELLRSGHAPWLDQVRERVYIGRDGARYAVQEIISTIKTDKGFMLVSTVRDVTASKQAEEALRRERDLVARIMETSPAGITMVDRDGQITFANRQAEKVLGLTRDEITTRTYNAPTWHIVDYEGNSFPEERLPFRRVMTNGRPVYDVHHAIEWPDGRLRMLCINAAPLFDEAGHIDGIVATVNDVTEQVQAERALQEEYAFRKESEARFRSLVESMDDVVFTLDCEQRHTGVFGRWVEKTGLTPETFLGKTSREIFGPEAASVHEAANARALAGEHVVYEWSTDSPAGALYYQTSLSPLQNDMGEVVGLVGVGRDVTIRKRTELLLRVQRDLGVALNKAHGLEQALPLCIEAALQISGFDSGGIYLLDDATGAMKLVYHTGLSANFVECASYYDADSPNVRMISAGNPVYVLYDQLDLPPEDFRRQEGLRAAAFIPVLYEGRVVACFNLASRTLSTVNDFSRTTIEAIAAQVGSVIARAKVEQEIRRRTSQLESLRQVGLDLTAQLDLDALLQSIVAHAVVLLEAKRGALYLYRPEKEHLELVVTSGFKKPLVNPVLKRGEGLSGEVWETGAPLILDDYRHWSGRADVYKDLPAAAIVGVPVYWGEEFLGVLNVTAGPPRTFSHADAELLNLLATQAAIAIRNANLFLAERQQRALTEALEEAAAAVNSTLDPHQVLDCILEQVERVVASDACNIMLVEGDGVARVVRWREHGDLYGDVSNIVFPIADYASLAQMMQTGKSVVVPDTLSDPSWIQLEGIGWQRAYVAAPIWMEGEVVGFLNVDGATPGQFTLDDARRLEAFASHAATAIEHAQLYRELQDHAEQLDQRVRERTAELQSQYARLDAILNSSTDGIVLTDAIGEIIQANPVARAWLAQTLSPEDAQRLRDLISELAARAAETSHRDDVPKVLSLTGLDLELRASLVLVEEADVPAIIVVDIHDVSYLKALDRMKTRFITDISHELRTPVTTIKLYTHLMQQRPEKWQDYLTLLIQQVDYQARLVEDIQEIVHFDAGRVMLFPNPTQLNELLMMVIQDYQSMTKERGVTLDYHLADPGPVALVDPHRTRQVLDNLIANAIQYTPRGALVTVSTATEEASGRVWATVQVSDTGIGIPEEELDHIFERFFRGKKPQLMRPGTGLGLCVVKEIVEMHGGRVTVESEVDVGSTFTVWLPLAEPRDTVKRADEK